MKMDIYLSTVRAVVARPGESFCIAMFQKKVRCSVSAPPRPFA